MEYADAANSQNSEVRASGASADTKDPVAGSTDAGIAYTGYTADGASRTDRAAASKAGSPNAFRNAGNAAGGTAAGKSKSPTQTGGVGTHTGSGLQNGEAGVSASDSTGSESAADTSDGQSEFAMGDIIDSIFSDDD